jgi:hypothetical protein
VVRIKPSHRETTDSDTEGECTICWFQMIWKWASETKDSCREIRFTECFRCIGGSQMVARMVVIGIGRHQRSEWCFRSMVRWMATWYLGAFSHCPMAERNILDNACEETYGVNETWQRRSIKRGTSARAWK